MGNSLKVIFTIIGTVIGAGFASGQEIYSFFNVYKELGFLGIIISCVITGIIIYVILTKSNKLNITTYKELLKNTKLTPRTVNIFNFIVNLFLLLSFYIMVAGFATYFNQEFNIPKIFMIIFAVCICYITFKKRIEGIAKINNIIIPILILIICILGVKANLTNKLKSFEIQLPQAISDCMWIIKSIEYASYNSILLIPMLISIKKYAKGNEKMISIISATILFILSSIIFFTLYKYRTIEINNIEMPMVYIAGKIGMIYKYIYGVVIVFSIYSTMISSGYGFLENLKKEEYEKLNKLICISAVFVAFISFSELVNFAYPIFGILGLVQLIYMLK